MAYQGGVQLLPQARKRVAPARRGPGRMVYMGLAIAAIVLVANITLDAFGTSVEEKIAALDGQMRTQENQRDKDREDELEQVQKQSLQMTQLLSNHLYWSQAFGRIEELMQSGVTLQKIDADASDGKIEFIAISPNFATVARQLASFNVGDGFNDVTLNNAQTDADGGIEFGGEIIVDTSDLLKRLTATPQPRAQDQ